MNHTKTFPPVVGGHKPCIPKRSRVAPLSEAAKALLSSPLPPELVVDFKGSALQTLTPCSSSSSSLRSSSSENNVNRPSNRGSGDCAHENVAVYAARTLSDGGTHNYIRRAIESEDSSYDSDYECTETIKFTTYEASAAAQDFILPTASGVASLQGNSLKHGKNHEDISRTVSDTLVAEFNEYINIQSPLTESKEQYSDETDSEDGTQAADDSQNGWSYAARVEFAVKLGYTELQVQKALAKLGPRTTQNELLAELIRLTALSGPPTIGPPLTPTNSVSPELKVTVLHAQRPLCSTYSDDGSFLRNIVIDGSNVAFSHGNKEIFSCRGIQLCVDWFRARGHQDITVFVPRWRKEASKADAPISNQEILLELEKDRMLVFTPSRQVGGRRLVCYDDRYILKLAAETDGIVVSNDNYRDLASENPGFRKIIEERILMYSFVNDRFMPPEDPLGRNGPKLDAFLRKVSLRSTADVAATALPCPYDKKCTYGNKCKYYHPERGNIPQKSVTERLVEHAHHQLLEAKSRQTSNTLAKKSNCSKETNLFKTFSLPGTQDGSVSTNKMPNPVKKMPLARTKSIIPTSHLPGELTDEGAPAVASVAQTDAQGVTVECMSKLPSTCPGNQLMVPLRGGLALCPPPTFNVPPPSLEVDSTWHRPPSHVTLCHKLSDPVSALTKLPSDSEKGEAHISGHQVIHRQLTLDPYSGVTDARLFNVGTLAPPYPPPPIGMHSIVTRNASAPAAHSQMGCSRAQYGRVVEPHRAQRLNSTSDTQVNLCGGDSSVSSDIHNLVDWGLRGSADPFDDAVSGGVVPISGMHQHQLHQPLHMNHQWACRTASLPNQQVLLAPPSTCAKTVVGERDACQTSRQESNKTEIREKLYYHLAAIFPEEQVRQVMQHLPNETDAQKICAAILAFYPK